MHALGVSTSRDACAQLHTKGATLRWPWRAACCSLRKPHLFNTTLCTGTTACTYAQHVLHGSTCTPLHLATISASPLWLVSYWQFLYVYDLQTWCALCTCPCRVQVCHACTIYGRSWTHLLWQQAIPSTWRWRFARCLTRAHLAGFDGFLCSCYAGQSFAVPGSDVRLAMHVGCTCEDGSAGLPAQNVHSCGHRLDLSQLAF